MKKLLGWLLNPWLWTLLGVAALALVIVLVGPLLSIGNVRPLDSTTARWATIAAVAALAIGWRIWSAVKARRTNQKVVEQLVVAAPGAPDAGTAEVALLAERFQQALQTLRDARFDGGALAATTGRWGKRYLYELPWYLIIGAPGAGKTTALLNSGLRFPLARSASAGAGPRSVRGVGGTRHCDWWFTDEAVLIDTAGRYTTQDSDRTTDSRAWGGFLELLKRHRKRQPINGVLVTVSVTDLLTRDAGEREEHAQAVRARIQELHQHLGIRFPIYLLVTKCDLLAGFTDFLGDIDKDTRETPWGFTFTLDEQHALDLGRFDAEFDALEQRLTDGLVDRLQQERDAQRRARIYAFPQQFDGLKAVLRGFVEQVFSPSQFEARPLLRGVYFVSGTQEGTPIDRMLGRIARTHGLERTPIPAHEGQGRSYFLTRLLRDVVFAESGLAGTNRRWERRRLAVSVVATGALAVVAAALLGAWFVSYSNNRDYLVQVDQKANEARALLQAAAAAGGGDPVALLPVLGATRELARAGIGDDVPWSLGFGLFQGRKLESAAQQAYRRLLGDGLLPRLAAQVERRLRDPGSNPELQYEALKAYVMLHDPAHFNADALKLFITADWQGSLAREVTTEQRAELESHLDELLRQGFVASPLPQDAALLAQSRARVAATPLAERIYRRLKRQGVGGDVPEFSVAKAAGPNAALVFRRASGAPLTRGIPGLFTHDGYHKAFQRAVTRVSAQLADEEVWVLGLSDAGRGARALDAIAQDRVSNQVRRLYLTDYAQLWEEFIADVKLLPTANLGQAVAMARVLSAPDNPLVPLMRALSHETTLGETREVATKVESRVRETVQQTREELGRLFGTEAAPAAVAPGARIESLVDDRFVALRRLVTAPPGGAAPIDGTVALINEVYTVLNAADSAVKAGTPPPPSETPNKVKAEAARLPEPVRSLLNTLSVAGTSAALGAARENLSQAVNTQVGDFCRQAIEGRYPFTRGSTRDVTREDFARLFAPGGLFDTFFQQNLAPIVDTGTRPWSFRQVSGATMGSPGMLVQFMHAATIRDTFFRAGGNVPGLRLEFKPQEMDASITQFILDVDGQLVKYAHGPQIPATVQWPGPGGSNQVRIALQPVAASGASGLVESGHWALFRLFDRMQVDVGPVPERFRATFDVGGRKASFDVTTSSVRNPFRLRELEDFKCPGRL
jgi:type VI secretion system protein ImpL